MLVTEWSRSGSIVWCNAKPVIREQLESILNNAAYCDSEQLGVLLTSKYNTRVYVQCDVRVYEESMGKRISQQIQGNCLCIKSCFNFWPNVSYPFK